ncbi:hypothetical protein HMPREF0454_03604 [Hafnia alvei ATCC 51873]|uniref:Uncharacterized protein n=1 Tax=Hafnia alvei ATCC 51873 TaxID=1002364 RepID=G9YAI0_HAFAL|nr:hypothetical protein F652_1428 [Enterobacteriaceae bacterium bta3-1]EHM39962.1 hypothetical protein HMPREF0454_03604 [Hafnia alvei ATCC 51873]
MPGDVLFRGSSLLNACFHLIARHLCHPWISEPWAMCAVKLKRGAQQDSVTVQQLSFLIHAE